MSKPSADPSQALQMLNDAHAFPCAFVFKAIGQNDPAFPASLMQAALLVVGSQQKPDMQLRESKHGRHVAVTMTLEVQSAEQVLAVYHALGSVRGLHMLL